MKKGFYAAMIFGLFTFSPLSQTAHAGPEPFLGEIMMFGGNFCPRGWGDANGQLMAVNQYQALYSILGTTYGGDGRTTFGLPDLRGRVAIHAGQGPGLSHRPLGAKSGEEKHTLNVSEMPSHSHKQKASNGLATSKAPGGKLQAKTRQNAYGSGSLTKMASQSVSTVGRGQSHNNMQPFLTIRFCISLQGIYPSRN